MKKLLALTLALVMVLALCACGGSSAPAANNATAAPAPESAPADTAAPAEPAAKTIVLRVGHKSSATSSWQLGAEYWNELLQKASGGTMSLEIFPNSQLGDQKEMTEMAQLGILDIVLNAPATLATFMDEISALDLPFLFRDYDHAFDCMDTVVMDYFDDAYKQVGLICLANWDTGFKYLTNNVREIKTADDIKGLKIRYAGGAALAGTIEALGASAISIPWSETYIALSQGTADAQFNPFDTTCDSKIHEVQHYFSNIPIQYGAEPITMSLKVWETLTPEQQGWLMETCKEAGVYQRQKSQELGQKAMQTVLDYGCVYTEVSPEVLADIQQRTAFLLEKYCPAELLAAIQAR